MTKSHGVAGGALGDGRRNGLGGTAPAIARMAERGYAATTADELAEVLGVSRSTFFRRYGGKDDLVFVDHDLALERLERFFATTGLPLADSLVEGTTDVLRWLTRDPESAQLRFGLVRADAQLRERELVITHRYEHVIRSHIARAAPTALPNWVPTALAASCVAMHNTALREWLQRPSADAPHRLAADLGALVARLRVELTAAERSVDREIVVTSFAPGTPAEAVAAAIAAQLSSSPPQPEN